MNQVVKDFRRFLAWVVPYSPTLFVGMVCVLVASGLTLVVPTLIGRGVAAGLRADPSSWKLVVAAILGKAAFGFLGAYWLGRAAVRAVTDLRRKLFDGFVQAPVTFHDYNWSANLVSVLTSDAAYIQEAVGRLIPVLAQHIPIALVAMVLLFVENWRMALGLTLTGVPLALMALLGGRTLRKLSQLGQEELGRMAVIAQESFQGLRVIKAMTREEYFTQRFAGLAERLFDIKRRRVLWQAGMESLLPLGAALVVLTGVWLAHGQLAEGRTTPAELATLGAYLAVLGMSARQLVYAYTTIEQVVGAGRRILDLRVAAREMNGKRGQPIGAASGAVRFDSVTFKYPEGQGGVRDISFSVAPGEVLAIVGPNGSGKSTLVHLLLKFYQPQQGSIILNDRAMMDADTASWRRQFAVVSRDPAIFSVSIAENIALGRPDATTSDIENAAKAVRLHEVIQRIPGGYDAQVGELGIRLSAGQRQRLALARIFLQDPSVIILDEATTSLDHDSEEALAEAMRQWVGRRTLIIISHQPITQWPVTRTLRIEAGRMVSG